MNRFVLLIISPIIITLALSWYIGGWMSKYTSPKFTFEDIPNLTGKVAIVTGANTGIGKVSARELARKGAHVILAARNSEKGLKAVQDIKQEVGLHANVEFMNLDLSSLQNVKEFCSSYLAKGLNTDIVMFNAGIMVPPFELTVDNVESQFGTNHLGHFLLFQLLQPNFIASKSRIVHVSSLAHQHTYSNGIYFENINNPTTYNRVFAYGQSKLANILFSHEISKRYSSAGITSFALHPGTIKSELSRHVDSMMNGFLFQSIYEIYTSARDAAFDMLAMTVDDGALNQLYVATHPSLSDKSDLYFDPIGQISTPMGVTDKLSSELWDYSMQLVAKFV